MTTHRIEDIRDIVVDTTKYETHIDFIDMRGSTDRYEVTWEIAELLYERLGEALNKVLK